MTFQATVIRVLVASPTDLGTTRAALRARLLDGWNSVYAEEGVVLLPQMWETESTPDLSDTPQGVINTQLGDKADIVLGAFWTRLGTPTDRAQSGTAEEIRRAVGAGKPVLLYFSRQPVDLGSVDQEQYQRLQEFKKEVPGLYADYFTEEELLQRVLTDLRRVIKEKLDVSLSSAPTVIASTPRAMIVCEGYSERTLQGYDPKGKAKYQSSHGILIENRGNAAAEEMSWRIEASEGRDSQRLPIDKNESHKVARLAPGQSMRFPLIVLNGTDDQCEVLLEWVEGGEQRSEQQTIRV